MSLPWWVETKGVHHESGALDIAGAKAQIPIGRVLEHFGGKPPADLTYQDWQAYRCPFHPDEHPSGSVNLRSGRFRCHVCDIGGDVVDVVAQHLGLTLKEALAWISTTLL